MVWAQSDRVEITNRTAHFFPGPYSALFVDPANPKRMALGTQNGRVLWTEDGGERVIESRVIPDRFYDPYVVRGGGQRASLSSRDSDGNTAFGADREPRHTLGGKLAHIPRPEQRSLLLFLDAMRSGRDGGRWNMWMGLQDPYTDVTSLALPSGKGGLALAGSGGIMISDRERAHWTRTVGGPAPMPRRRDTFGTAVAIDPADPSHMLASTDRGLLVSHDGGWNFNPHTEPSMSEVVISKFIWSAENPNELFAVAGDSVLESSDGGKSFTTAYSAPQEIRDLAIAEGAGYIATADGVHILGATETVGRALEGEDVIGVCAWRAGLALAATRQRLVIVDPNGNSSTILVTSDSDKFVGLAGNGNGAWLVSERAIMHIGAPIERREEPNYKAPRLRLTQAQIEKAVLKNFKIGPPIETRLHDRWYAKLIPHINVEIEGGLNYRDYQIRDATFPVRFLQTGAVEQSRVQWAVFANWDLTRWLLGNNNVSNPFLVIENGVREKRKALVAEVRWHYREADAMARQLARPPADAKTEALWRSRLDEMGSYLEALSGEKLVENNDAESFR